MVNTSAHDPSQIDEFLPTRDFRAAYEIHIDAPTSVVYECLLRTDFSEAWLVLLLMTFRTERRVARSSMRSDLRQRLQGTGFVILAEVPNQQLLIGVAGRFWRPDGGRCMDFTAGDLASFSRHGYAKVARNFKTASTFDREYRSFNRDEGQVLRLGGVLEVSPLLEFGRPVLWPDAKDHQVDEQQHRQSAQHAFHGMQRAPECELLSRLP